MRFDEIEKTHPDAFNPLLQALDDGRITDAQDRQAGEVVDRASTCVDAEEVAVSYADTGGRDRRERGRGPGRTRARGGFHMSEHELTAQRPMARAATAGRVVVASYPAYNAPERAVDPLSDRKFPVERVAIVGEGLKAVEFDPVASRGWLIVDGLWFGLVIGLLWGLLLHALPGGRRDFVSVGGLQADRYNGRRRAGRGGGAPAAGGGPSPITAQTPQRLADFQRRSTCCRTT